MDYDLTVIGGGVIGLEMASYYAIAGVKVPRRRERNREKEKDRRHGA